MRLGIHLPAAGFGRFRVAGFAGFVEGRFVVAAQGFRGGLGGVWREVGGGGKPGRPEGSTI
jgi:hypothetical protein